MLSMILLTIIGISYAQCNVYNDGNPSSEEGAVLCADEADGEFCVGPGRIYYGSETYGETWAYEDLGIGETIECSNTAFGCDPVPGYQKQCYRACHNNYHYGLPRIKMAAVYCASQIDGNSCTGPGRVYYGDESQGYQWAYTDLEAGESIQCQKVNFEGCDPVYGVSKSCYIERGNCHNNGNYLYFDNDGTPATEEDAYYCASQLDGGNCTGPGRVYYGDEEKGIRWGYTDLDDGQSIECQKVNFDGCDPVPNVSKSCYIKKYEYVEVNFEMIKILKTNSDGTNGGNVEEWNVVTNDSIPTISMNVDFIDVNKVFYGCTFILGPLLYAEPDEFTECQPPTESESDTGVDTCYIGVLPPKLYVSKEVYEAGLKYTFDFQIGDFDANDEFDNGPTFSFTYTEPDHKSIDDLRNNNGVIERYFTRTGPEGRKARLFAIYTLIEKDEPITVTTDTCN